MRFATRTSLLLLLTLIPTILTLRLRKLWRSRSCIDVVVKFGGSAITNKATLETLDEAALAKTAAACANSKNKRAVLMHGAGSFGHFQARQYGVSKGIAHETFEWRGFAETRASVTKLNGLVVGALCNAGVAAAALPPFPTFVTRGKGIVTKRSLEAGLTHIEELLDAGLTPVLHGDAVLDEVQGCSILSGDTLMVLLARAFKPSMAVFLTDVAGVYDRPPTEEGASLLPRIGVEADGTLRVAAATSTASHDVTGGLAAKIDAAAQIALSGCRVVIVQVGTRHAEAALRGELPEVCTLIEREAA